MKTLSAVVRDACGEVAGAVGAAIDITERKLAEAEPVRLARQLTVQRSPLVVSDVIANIVARSTSLEEAAPRILKALCEHLSAEMSALWLPDASGKRLACAGFHTTIVAGAVVRLKQFTERTTFGRGEGLPGEVWQTGTPAWAKGFIEDRSSSGKEPIAEPGLLAGAAFPILLRDDCIGVMTLFIRQVMSPDQALLDMMSAIGHEVGQFIERTR